MNRAEITQLWGEKLYSYHDAVLQGYFGGYERWDI